MPLSTEVEVYQLRVYLRKVSPMIWRRLLVRSDSTIADLHHILQTVMGWHDVHLHHFLIRGKRYGIAQIGTWGFMDRAEHIIADISLWEIAMLLEKKRLQVNVDSQAFLNLILQANKTLVQLITAEIAALAMEFPSRISQDPADRLIAATTLARNATLVTADKNLQDSNLIPTLW